MCCTAYGYVAAIEFMTDQPPSIFYVEWKLDHSVVQGVELHTSNKSNPDMWDYPGDLIESHYFGERGRGGDETTGASTLSGNRM
jgi:hypothetical protein